MIIFLFLVFFVMFTILFENNFNFQKNKLWNLVRPMVTLATGPNDTFHASDHVYNVSTRKQLRLSSSKPNKSLKDNSKTSTESADNRLLQEQAGRDPTARVPNIRVVNNSRPLIDKMQHFLSSLPNQDKNSPLFDNIQSYLIKLKDQNTSGLELTAKQDVPPNVANIIIPNPTVFVPHPHINESDSNSTIPNKKTVVPDQQRKVSGKERENTIDNIKQSSAKKTEAENNDTRPQQRCDASKYLSKCCKSTTASRQYFILL